MHFGANLFLQSQQRELTKLDFTLSANTASQQISERKAQGMLAPADPCMNWIKLGTWNSDLTDPSKLVSHFSSGQKHPFYVCHCKMLRQHITASFYLFFLKAILHFNIMGWRQKLIGFELKEKSSLVSLRPPFLISNFPDSRKTPPFFSFSTLMEP